MEASAVLDRQSTLLTALLSCTSWTFGALQTDSVTVADVTLQTRTWCLSDRLGAQQLLKRGQAESTLEHFV